MFFSSLLSPMRGDLILGNRAGFTCCVLLTFRDETTRAGGCDPFNPCLEFCVLSVPPGTSRAIAPLERILSEEPRLRDRSFVDLEFRCVSHVMSTEGTVCCFDVSVPILAAAPPELTVASAPGPSSTHSIVPGEDA